MKDRIFVIAENSKGEVSGIELYNMLRLYGWTPNVDLFMTKETELGKIDGEIQDKLIAYTIDKEKAEMETRAFGKQNDARFKTICTYGISGKHHIIPEDIIQQVQDKINLPNIEAVILVPTDGDVIHKTDWLLKINDGSTPNNNQEELERLLVIMSEIKRNREYGNYHLYDVLARAQNIITSRLTEIERMRLEGKQLPQGSINCQTIKDPKIDVDELQTYVEMKEQELTSRIRGMVNAAKLIDGVSHISYHNSGKMFTNEYLMKELLKQDFSKLKHNVTISGYEKNKIIIVPQKDDKLMNLRCEMLDAIGDIRRNDERTYTFTYPEYLYPTTLSIVDKIIGSDLKGLETVLMDETNRRIFSQDKYRKNASYLLNDVLPRIQKEMIKQQAMNNELIKVKNQSYPLTTKWLSEVETNQLDVAKRNYLEYILLDKLPFGISKLDNSQILDIKNKLAICDIEQVEKVIGMNEEELRNMLEDNIKSLETNVNKIRDEIRYLDFDEHESKARKFRRIDTMKGQINVYKKMLRDLNKERATSVLKSFLGLTEGRETKQENIDER